MTISKAIKEWLEQNELLKIETEILGSEIGDLSLSKTPENTVIKFINGSELRTEYYMFFARQSTQLEIERITNDEFLESLELWVWNKNQERNFPILDEKRKCENISISSSFYLFEENEEEGIYTFTIEIKYRKEI